MLCQHCFMQSWEQPCSYSHFTDDGRVGKSLAQAAAAGTC